MSEEMPPAAKEPLERGSLDSPELFEARLDQQAMNLVAAI